MFRQLVYSGQEEKMCSRTQELDVIPMGVGVSMRKIPASFLNGEQMYVKNSSQLLESAGGIP